MSKFPFICGIVGKKLYLLLLLAFTLILYGILRIEIIQGFDSKSLINNPDINNKSITGLQLINNLGGNILQMLSIFIPCIFKFKGKSKNSTKKCTKANFKDYFILSLIILLIIGIEILLQRFNKYDIIINFTYISLCFQMIFYILSSIIILKAKYYIHNIISSILFCIFSVINDLILDNFKIIEPISLLSLLPNLVDDLLCCYMKYLIDKKYHSIWNILFFLGLFFFIFNLIDFIIIIINDPYNNYIFKAMKITGTKYIILNFFLDAILNQFLRMLLTLIILEYFSLNHVLISLLLFRIAISIYLHELIFKFIIILVDKKYLFFLIPAFFQILSLLFYLEIFEFNFCNLNRNTKRNIMLREEEEMLLRNNTNVSEIEVEIDKDLIVKNPQEKKDLELYDMIDDSEEKENDSEN